MIKESNKEADAKYATNKDGTDPVEEESYLGYDLYMAKKFKNDNVETSKLNFNRYLFRVNKYAVFYGDVSTGYRGIMGSIQLDEIIDDQDDIQSGKCCTRVEEVQKEENVVLGITELDLFCFTISLEDYNYILCHEDKAKANDARNMVVLGVIKHYFWK